ncbi:hypothetical protein [Paenibacillus sp. FSL H8-0034]|uniref:hypothetical protein n=1 Tax=Paenibacillus sp. FSL H8-0034 TaxID=2954671 RepID=UPI0030FBF103
MVNQLASPPAFKEVDLGKVTFGTSGVKQFKFILTGTTSTEAAGKYWMGMDAISLTPLP